MTHRKPARKDTQHPAPTTPAPSQPQKPADTPYTFKDFASI